MADINEIAKVFVDFYYSNFDADRNNLRNVYVMHCFFKNSNLKFYFN